MIDGFLIDGSGYSSRNFFDQARGSSSTSSVPGLTRVDVVTMVAVTRLLWLNSARTLRVVAVVLIARLARCARWLWLGSHDARTAGGAAGASQQLLYKRRTPNIFYLHGCRTKRRRRFINYV